MFAGVTHEGTPTGKIETIGGIECYVATPTVDYPKDKVLLYITDVFGYAFVNCKVRCLSIRLGLILGLANAEAAEHIAACGRLCPERI
jgi:hypothetical protein